MIKNEKSSLKNKSGFYERKVKRYINFTTLRILVIMLIAFSFTYFAGFFIFGESGVLILQIMLAFTVLLSIFYGFDEERMALDAAKRYKRLLKTPRFLGGVGEVEKHEFEDEWVRFWELFGRFSIVLALLIFAYGLSQALMQASLEASI